ncbi:hypothetical protein [Streptomyces werraensis]|uniref:hypothetical protein n=1 Tax=Streptomyces werraensis TaxID=68284 RepID=UPI0034197143
MSGTRVEIWIRCATSMTQFLDYFGNHIVAYPLGVEQDAFGGQFIMLDPTAETVGLRRYDTGEIRQFPWFTTSFKVTTHIESPFAELTVGMVRRFEWWSEPDGQALLEPVSLLGTVTAVTAGAVELWVRNRSLPEGGFTARIKADDAARHSVRPPAPSRPAE